MFVSSCPQGGSKALHMNVHTTARSFHSCFRSDSAVYGYYQIQTLEGDDDLEEVEISRKTVRSQYLNH